MFTSYVFFFVSTKDWLEQALLEQQEIHLKNVYNDLLIEINCKWIKSTWSCESFTSWTRDAIECRLIGVQNKLLK